MTDYTLTEPNQRIDLELSKQLGKKCNAAPRFCFANAIQVLQRCPDLDLRFVEGWVCDLAVFEHGWLETADGQVIDPTLSCMDPLTEKRAYFAGFTYDREEALTRYKEKVRTSRIRVFPLRTGKADPFGLRDPAYVQAMISANVYSGVPLEWYLKGGYLNGELQTK